jgi:cyclase
MSPARRFGIVVLALLVGAAAALAQQRDWSKVEIKPTKVADGVWMLEGAGGNIGVCGGEDGVLMIDDQFAPLSDKIKAAIAALDPHPIRFLVNTHRHGDHTGGNENFANLGVTIFAHDNVRKRMSADQVNPFSGDTTKASPAKALPLVTFNDSLTFHVNGQTITLFHVAPAHTDGDVVVWFRDRNVVHAGDCLFNGRYPVIDYAAGGSLEGMIAASERLLAAFGPDTKFIPGHGPLATRADVQALHDMLVTVRGRLLPLIAQKKSVAEIQAAKPLADLDAKWGASAGAADAFIARVVPGMAATGK